MTWRHVDPKFVRQDDPQLRAEWYSDWAERGGGELMMWLDRGGRVRAFQLSHEEWPSLKHYVAAWQSGTGLRVGEVDEGDRARSLSRLHAPVMRFAPVADSRAAGRLLEYFRSNADALEPLQRTTISAVLGESSGQ